MVIGKYSCESSGLLPSMLIRRSLHAALISCSCKGCGSATCGRLSVLGANSAGRSSLTIDDESDSSNDELVNLIKGLTGEIFVVTSIRSTEDVGLLVVFSLSEMRLLLIEAKFRNSLKFLTTFCLVVFLSSSDDESEASPLL